MEGLVYGVAAMLVKDVVSKPYHKGRDYERNVRQAYRDVDNLQITLDQTISNCKGLTLSNAQAEFVRRAEQQKRDAYRTLRKKYQRNPSRSHLLHYASTPGAEMNLLDIGKEANQTAKGLNDLLAEIRFSKLGGDKEDGKAEDGEKGKKKDKPPTRPSLDLSRVHSGDAPSRRPSSPCSISSRHSSVFSLANPIQHSGIHSPPSSTSSFVGPSRRNSTSSPRSTRSKHLGHRKHELLTPSSWPRADPFTTILGPHRQRDRALDDLQHGIDQVLTAADQDHEYDAMLYLEHALSDVLRLQRAQGLGGPQADGDLGDLGDAVEALDAAMRDLAAARGEGHRGRALRGLSRALEDVDEALYARRKNRGLHGREEPHRAAARSPVRVSGGRRGAGRT